MSEAALFVVDEGDLRKYRTETPNIVFDLGLGPHAGWLYVHIKRIAGDSGVCWQGIRSLAKTAGMSVGKASQARRELEAHGLIVVRSGDHKQGEADEVRVVNLWSRNFRHFDAKPPSGPVADETRSPDEHPVHDMNTPPCSQYERAPQACSRDEHPPEPEVDPRSRCEHKKEPLEQVQERPPNGGPKKPAVSSPPPKPKKRIAALKDEEAQSLFDELCDSDPNGAALRSLAATLAEENRTGNVAITRVWRELGERYVRTRKREDLPEEAWAYGFEQALSRGAPNIGYVLSAARGYRPPAARRAAPGARGRPARGGVAVIGATEESYDGDF